MARISLQMWHGYNSYQLAFGKNPNLPNIVMDILLALAGTSEILAKHLQALHESRKAFIQSEADESIRQAFRQAISGSKLFYNPNDRVFYKREEHNQWLGPAKVIFQDGKVFFSQKISP